MKVRYDHEMRSPYVRAVNKRGYYVGNQFSRDLTEKMEDL